MRARSAAILAFLWLACLAAGFIRTATAQDFFHAGPIWDESPLTLGKGERTEVGPLFYKEIDEGRHTWAISPLLSYFRDDELETMEFDILYPVISYDRYGKQYRFQIFQLFSFAGGPTQTEPERHRFTLYPVFFSQWSSDTNQNYTAYGPFYGHLNHRLNRDEIEYVMFPLYSKTRKADIVTKNYLYPIYHVRHGEGLNGWQLWPFYGSEYKDITTKTDSFGDTEKVPGHDSVFVMWPLYLRQVDGIGTANMSIQRSYIPFYSTQRSPARDSTTVIWPFFSHVDDRQAGYREWDLPWPLIVFANGSKHINRVFPIYSHAYNTNLVSDFILWPVYKYNAIHTEAMERKRTRILFFLYSDVREKNLDTGKSRRRIDFLPLFTHRRDLNGNTRLQVIAPLEPFVPGSHKIDRDWSYCWSLWRNEHNAESGARSQSLLWNLYRRNWGEDGSESSVLFGLYQSSSNPTNTIRKIFFIPVQRTTRAGSAAGVPDRKT